MVRAKVVKFDSVTRHHCCYLTHAKPFRWLRLCECSLFWIINFRWHAMTLCLFASQHVSRAHQFIHEISPFAALYSVGRRICRWFLVRFSSNDPDELCKSFDFICTKNCLYVVAATFFSSVFFFSYFGSRWLCLGFMMI